MTRLLGIVVAALVIRLALAPFGQFEGDVNFAREWGNQLADAGPGSFYDVTDADHLPGDLWVFWGLGEFIDLESHASALGTESAVLSVKLVPILADVAIVALLFAIGRRIAGERAGLVAAALYALNPAPIFVASTWGQWDSLSAAFALLAVWLYLRGWSLWSLPAITYALLIKPQLGAIALVLAVAATLGPRELRPSRRHLALGAALSAGLLVALTAPFDIAPWPSGETLFDRARVAFERYQDPTVSGFNVWELQSDVLSRDTDSQTLLLGMGYRTVSVALLLAAFAAIVVRLGRLPSRDRLLWACLGVTMALFVLPTRVHERWILPAVVFAAAVAACDRRYRAVAVLLGLSAFANIFWIYDLRWRGPDLPLISDGNESAPLVFALINLGLLAYILISPTRQAQDSNLRHASWQDRSRARRLGPAYSAEGGGNDRGWSPVVGRGRPSRRSRISDAAPRT